MHIQNTYPLTKVDKYTVEPSIEIGVYGGYTDIRGDAAKNSLSLLNSLYSHWVSYNNYLGLRKQTVGH